MTVSNSAWNTPLVVAVLAATLAGMVNAGIAVFNSAENRKSGEQAAENARIIAMIEIADPDQAALNLEFLLDTGLVENPELVTKIRRYLNSRVPGQGPGASSVLRADGVVSFLKSEIERGEISVQTSADSTIVNISSFELFENGSSRVSAGGMALLVKGLDSFADGQKQHVRIRVHADGSQAQATIDLADSWAEGLEVALASLELAPEFTWSVDSVYDEPVADPASPEGRALNVRIELIADTKPPSTAD